MKKTNAVRLLDQKKVKYEMLEYQYDAENLSVDKIAHANDLETAQVFKTLVAKGDKTGVIVAVVGGDKTLNFKSLAKASDNKKITLVPVKELLELTGYIRGGCSPIGMKKNFPIFIDKSATEFESLYLNAGIRGLFIKIRLEDLVKVTNGTVTSITDAV